MKNESRIYRLTGLTPILGVTPTTETLLTEYVMSKAKLTEEQQEAELEAMPESDIPGLTGFSRNKKDELCLSHHHIKGFFKEALKALRATDKVTAYKTKVDLLIFAEPTLIPFKRDGKPIMEEDRIFERPIRIEGMTGTRTALCASETIDDPWSVDVEITLFPDDGKTPLTWNIVEEALAYGAYHGLGQWRNGGYGRFTFERLADEEEG